MNSNNSITQPVKRLEQAKRLLSEFNLCVIPSGQKRVDSEGKISFKSPWVKWEQYNQQGAIKPTVEQLETWEKQYHPTLWGFITGHISGITVFDADSPEAIDIFFNVGLQPHVITKRGQHYYFQYPGEQFDHLLYTVAGVIPHVDIRSKGGFVNCLGINSSASYQMIKAPSKDNLYDIKQLPPEVIEGISKLQNKQGLAVREPIGDCIPEGKRDWTIFRIACSLNHWGINQPVIEETLLQINSRLCKPPLPDSIVIDKVKSASKYPDDNEQIDQQPISFKGVPA